MDIFRQFALLGTNTYFMIGLGLIGALGFKYRPFLDALILVMFTTVYNLFLKSLFEIPLPETLGKTGWAFPSGHMHVCVVFWGWLTLTYPGTWRKYIGLFAIYLGAGYALIDSGYHYFNDILGAIGFGGITLAVVYGMAKYTKKSLMPYMFWGLVFIALGLIAALPSEVRHIYLGLSWLGLLIIGSLQGWRPFGYLARA